MELVPHLPVRVHLLGLAGAGVSGAARLLAARGHRVSGHDRAATPFLDGLEELGVAVEVGPSRTGSLPAEAGVVVRSAAVGDDDPQVVAARARGLAVLKYAEVVPLLAPADRTLAVAGTHGKTTTTWFLARALEGTARALGGPAPGALVGGTDRERGTNAVAPERGGWFAVEACEYDRSFLALEPFGAVITNVEADHLDCYGSEERVVEAFARFARRVRPDGLLVVSDEVPEAVEHAARCAVWRVGRELELRPERGAAGRARTSLRGPGFFLAPVDLALPGRVAAVDAGLAAALALGLVPERARRDAAPEVGRALAAYRGSARRFEPWGRYGEGAAAIDLVHDYAHHPTELAATFEAARAAYGGRPLVALFQPHQHSRTAHFLEAFADRLADLDLVVVTEVYGARTHTDGAHFAGARALCEAVVARGGRAVLAPALGEAAARFADLVPEGSVALVLGAGDVETVQHELDRRLSLRFTSAGAAR